MWSIGFVLEQAFIVFNFFYEMESFECILVLGAQKPGCTTPKMMNTVPYIVNSLYFTCFI